ncbi:PREDICTED: zinc finger protein ZOP1 [Ipomoea nil]|uniref:zinc finger protein ZOP1 n=1 Tax=Ipomoea nil TaxID=35883 RepID=UPI000901ABC1|nr:PREDICTED: zinc finger protein ZOP1 [Ipomoea nil]
MTEYWVSQGNKWCDFCKIYISNNPSSIRNHELGQRHKDNVAKRLSAMRQEKTAKEKEHKEATRALEQIEAKAQRSYQKDVARVREGAKDSTISEDWEYDNSSGYYYNQNNGCYYDPKSGFYYTDALGRWVTQEEALAATRAPSESVSKKPILKSPVPETKSESSGDKTHQSGPPPGRVVSTPLDPTRSVKGAPSSLTVNNSKRKRETAKPKAVSEAESAALKAREAARKRVEKREKSLLGLYKH